MTRCVGRGAWCLGLAVLFAGCGGERAGGGMADTAKAVTAAPAAADGRAVFGRTCVTCHQQNGQGMPGTFPPLAGSPFVNGDAGRLARIVLHGLQGPLEVHGQHYNNIMPPWRSLSDAEIAAVLTYVRASFGNTAGAVSAEAVARARAATAGRTTMFTAGELGTP